MALNMQTAISLITIVTSLTAVISSCPQKDSMVKSLSGFQDKDMPCMYSGFISIDEKSNSQLFYALTLSSDWEKAPLIIWLSGGAGASSLFGLFTEIGPLRVRSTGEFYVDKELTWTKNANVLFVDQPVGAGYSFTDDLQILPKTPVNIAQHFYIFIQKFLLIHKEMVIKNTYIIGQSYSGKYIPAIANFIMEENDKIDKATSHNQKVNIKKIAIGNGLFDARFQIGARKDLAKGVSILSEFDDEPQYDTLVKNCEFSLSLNRTDSTANCNKILDYVLDLAGDVWSNDIRKSGDNDVAVVKALTSYLNKEEIVTALHVKNNTIKNSPYWSFDNETVKNALKDDILVASTHYLESLMDKFDLPIVLYSGQFDLEDGPQGIERTIRNMNFKGVENWKNSAKELWKIETPNKEYVIAGYIKQYNNMVFVTMRNAGHLAPRDRPSSSLNLLDHLFSEEKLIKCPDSKCSLVDKKCKAMRSCNGNGSCNDSTGGKCICVNGFYGPDCSMKPELLLSKKVVKISPRDTKMFNLSHYDTDVLLEIDSDDHNVVVSLVHKKDHEYIFNPKEHLITYRLVNHKLVLFVEKDRFEDYLIVITNLEFIDEITLSMFVTAFNFNKNNFWGPGGFGFFLGIFSLALGIALFVAAFYLYRRYKQEKAYEMIHSGDEGYKFVHKI